MALKRTLLLVSNKLLVSNSFGQVTLVFFLTLHELKLSVIVTLIWESHAFLCMGKQVHFAFLVC